MAEFNIDKKIGVGSYAVVRTATDADTGEVFVLKQYNTPKLLTRSRKRSIHNEIKNLKKLSHKNIIKFITAINTKKQIVIVMEYACTNTLAHFLKEGGRLTLDESLEIFKQIVSGIAYMHEQKIAHRDIKLENILIDPNFQIKIIDFGFSVDFSDERRKFHTRLGTPCYMAPEIVN